MVNTSFWNERRVFLTGHTGFKGSWLAMWLARLGAQVTGYALPAETPGLFGQARVDALVDHIEGDIRDRDALGAAMARAQPEIVFHLAAQPLVRLSYQCPVDTFETNVIGTVNVLDACRRIDGLKAIVCVTSDKCYENREWDRSYREDDPMGGHDPYSASKGAAELVAASYRRSFFQHDGLLASARAGNVIGGGDWSLDRLIPDIVRATLAGVSPVIRSPASIRPWQHVFDALSGYLLLAQHLCDGHEWAAAGWNFGPSDEDARPVSWIADRITSSWDGGGWSLSGEPQPHEAKLLKLDSSKARDELGWRPAMRLDEAIDRVIDWHKAVDRGEDPREVSFAQLDQYDMALRSAAMEKFGV